MQSGLTHCHLLVRSCTSPSCASISRSCGEPRAWMQAEQQSTACFDCLSIRLNCDCRCAELTVQQPHHDVNRPRGKCKKGHHPLGRWQDNVAALPVVAMGNPKRSLFAVAFLQSASCYLSSVQTFDILRRSVFIRACCRIRCRYRFIRFRCVYTTFEGRRKLFTFRFAVVCQFYAAAYTALKLALPWTQSTAEGRKLLLKVTQQCPLKSPRRVCL